MNARALRLIASLSLTSAVALSALPTLSFAVDCDKDELIQLLTDYIDEQHGRSMKFPGLSVVYLDTAEERLPYTLKFKDGKICDVKGNPLTTVSDATIDFVIDSEGRFLGFPRPAKYIPGQLHHSSMVAGEDIIAGGTMKLKNGKLVKITNQSGHYKPKPYTLDTALKKLKALGINVDDVDVVFEQLPLQRALDIKLKGKDILGKLQKSDDKLFSFFKNYLLENPDTQNKVPLILMLLKSPIPDSPQFTRIIAESLSSENQTNRMRILKALQSRTMISRPNEVAELIDLLMHSAKSTSTQQEYLETLVPHFLSRHSNYLTLENWLKASRTHTYSSKTQHLILQTITKHVELEIEDLITDSTVVANPYPKLLQIIERELGSSTNEEIQTSLKKLRSLCDSSKERLQKQIEHNLKEMRKSVPF